MSESPGAGSWFESARPLGDDYDAAVAQRLVGQRSHGEADFVEELCRRATGEGFHPGETGVLDGGCGTGRVGIELARRGFDVTGVDVDPHMLETARRKAPAMSWLLADLAEVRLDRVVDVVVLAGNVLIFVGRGREPAVVRNLAQLLKPEGYVVAGFELTLGGFSLA
ncbi:MAG: class I SAM-dependent DNA methyltransferase, partial [Chloroflexota bacterium]